MTPEKEAESAVYNEERFRDLVEHVSDWIWEVDQNGIYTYASPRIQEMLGYSPSEIVGKTPFDLMPPEEAERIKPIFHSLVSEKLPIKSLENINVHREGHTVILETSGNPIFNEQGECIGYRGVDRDITSRKQIERRQQQLLDILNASPDFIATVDATGQTTYLNPAACQLLGVEAADEKPDFTVWLPDWARTLISEEALPTATCEGKWKGESALLKQDGSEVPVSQTIVAHKADDGTVQFFSTIARDISDMKELEKQISYQALYDSLTNLPNRRYLYQRLSGLIEQEALERKIVLFFMDLDNFKAINDTLGHNLGDRLLEQIALRLKSCVPAESFICRYGGDEFIIILENIKQEQEVEQEIARILHACSDPFAIEDYSVNVTWSIGVSVYPEHGSDQESLIKRADETMYKAKRQGKNAIVFE